ncbi:DUF2442 domain-containing protein [Limnohabitans sp.]|uniref:DUF2442 domain-containing protein n=1 Tax=Limnohabitans sp. TaxID=1907725 RepID=UPI0025C1BB62|nr:DUF2442 domain-containing protein [Limnohabitans sp.]
MTKANTPEWIKTELARVETVQARGQVEQASGLQALSARYDTRKKHIVVDLINGSSFSFPPHLAQGLANARPAELADIEISPYGIGLHWPQLDADLTVEGLLAGLFGSRSWMRQHAAKAGSVKSEAKTQAAKANGAKGGRPRQSTAAPA